MDESEAQKLRIRQKSDQTRLKNLRSIVADNLRPLKPYEIKTLKKLEAEEKNAR